MSTIVTRELSIDYDNAKTYLTGDGAVSIPITPSSLIGKTNCAVGFYTNDSEASGCATLNSVAMEALYPNEYAIPHQLDTGVLNAYRYNGSTEDANSAYISINGTTYAKLILTKDETNYIQTGITDISTTRNNTTIQCCITKNNGSTSYLTGVAIATDCYFKLYFKQLTCAAVASTAGIAGITVSNPIPYVGESVTYTATLANDEVVFYGWATDMGGTNIVSQNLSYTCSPTEDLVLYALSSSTSAPTTNHETYDGNIACLTDNNYESYWRTSSEQATGTYVQYMFHQPIFFIGVQTESITYPDECITRGSVLQVTTDGGTTWETVGRFTGEPSCTIAGVHKENTNGFRIYVEEASNTKFCVNEIIMYYTVEKPVCNVIKAVYKKVNGVWTLHTDMLSLFEHGTAFMY
mgnify:CR=1 FL=1